MRFIEVPVLGCSVSTIGFGCASLGSRVGRDEGLAAIGRAFDFGVSWFDVAPSYGDGEAEVNLSRFVQGRRDKIQLCSKVGILPARTPWLMRRVKPVARAIVNCVPSLRGVFARSRPYASKVTLNPELILNSVDSSLRRLRTDYLDVLALHDAEDSEVTADKTVRTLEELVKSGKVRAISVASKLSAGLQAASVGWPYGIIQVSNNPFEANVKRGQLALKDCSRITFVSHSSYGRAGALSAVISRLREEEGFSHELSKLGYSGNVDEVAAAILMDYALLSNRNGITLVSMFKESHFRFNLARLDAIGQVRDVDALLNSIEVLMNGRS